MALMKSYNVPKDAVVLDEVEATTYAWEIVDKWDKRSQTWALHYAPAFLGSINAVSGVLINHHYRKKLKLGNFGYFSSILPISLMPGLMTALFHRHIISTGLLLMKNDACPVCYEIKSVIIQCGFGIAYPMVLGPTSALMFASRYSTYRVPYLTEGTKAVFEFLRKITKPFTGTLATLGAIQFVAASAMTYFEIKNNLAIRKKLAEIEKKIESEELS